MIPTKRKTTLVLKKFLRDNKNILKELEKQVPRQNHILVNLG